mgnify:FL=1
MSSTENEWNKQTLRNSEDKGVYFRSDRFYEVDKKHYFSTREGIEIGPFRSKNEADLDFERFIGRIEKNKLRSPPKRLLYQALELSQVINNA